MCGKLGNGLAILCWGFTCKACADDFENAMVSMRKNENVNK